MASPTLLSLLISVPAGSPVEQCRAVNGCRALLMTVWRRKPKDRVLIQSDHPVHQHGLGRVPHAPQSGSLEVDAALP